MSDSSLAAILRLLRAQSFVEARIDPGLGAVHGLALRELMFLMQLDQAPANRLRRVDLADRLNVSQSTVTRLALPLEKLGFVKREADPRDARVGYVVLTKAGRQRVAEARATLEAQCRRASSATAGPTRTSPRWRVCSAASRRPFPAT